MPREPHRAGRRLRATVVNHVAPGSEVHAAWDELARRCAAPLATPAWMLAWWRRARPAGARLRVVTVSEGSRVVAVVPLYAEPIEGGLHRYRLLAGPLVGRGVPLVAAADADAVVPVLAAALRALEPRPDLIAFDSVPAAHAWAERLAEAWPTPRRPSLWTGFPLTAPYVPVRSSFAEWLATRHKDVRQSLRRHRRRLERDDAVFRLAGPAELERDLQTLFDLHHGRWAERGGSAYLDDTAMAVARDAAPQLVPDGGFRVWVLELGGRPVAAQALLAAGGCAVGWIGGFDDRWARYQPALQTIVRALEDAFDRPDDRLSLGPGMFAYKAKLADHHEQLVDAVLVPPGPRAPLALLRQRAGVWRHDLAVRWRPAAGRRVGRVLRPRAG